MTDFRKIISEFSVEPRAFGQHDALLVKEECKQRPGRAGFHQGVQSRQPRWKTGIRYCSLAAGIIFFLNLMFLLIAEGLQKFPALAKDDGRRVLHEGSCKFVKRTNTGVHFMINVMGTILLGASNYCMQCLSAPTRAEVNQAHAKFSWVDIGVPSVRNLFRIRKLRVLLWVILGLSSLPLHLFYNSIVFSTITPMDYMVFSANEAFIDASTKDFIAERGTNRTQLGNGENDLLYSPKRRQVAERVADYMFALAHNQSLEQFSSSECVDLYARNYQATYGNLLLIVPDTTENYTSGAVIGYEASAGGSFDWICENMALPPGTSCTNNIKGLKRNISHWQPYRKPITYCMAEKVGEHCRLEYSVHLVLLVVVIGLCKVLAMLLVAFTVEGTPILTIGDAISSFLDDPDPKLRGMCLLDKYLKGYSAQSSTAHHDHEVNEGSSPRPYHRNTKRNFSAASKRRWTYFAVTVFVAVGGTITSFWSTIVYFKGDDMNGTSLFASGLGTVDPRSIFGLPLPFLGVPALFVTVLLFNLPQVLLSCLYLNYNGLMTTMSLAREWASYGTSRKGLRVSTTPRGAQRSGYFLQLPYRYGLPILVTTGVLHWLVSQSVFFVSLQGMYLKCLSGYDYSDGEVSGACSGPIWDSVDAQPYELGGAFSRVGILATLIVGSLFLTWILCLGFKKLPPHMPVVSSCSAAIAAACHVLPEEVGQMTAEAEVMWGAMGDDSAEIGHCGFSMYEVRQPVEGKLYA